MKSSESASNVIAVSEEVLEIISNNKMIAEYMDNKVLPSIDNLLDRRLLVTEMDKEGLLTHQWLQAELIAVDFLLSKHK